MSILSEYAGKLMLFTVNARSGTGLPAGFFEGGAAPGSPSAANGIHGARDMPVSEVRLHTMCWCLESSGTAAHMLQL
jgi:hypothetical protein